MELVLKTGRLANRVLTLACAYVSCHGFVFDANPGKVRRLLPHEKCYCPRVQPVRLVALASMYPHHGCPARVDLEDHLAFAHQALGETPSPAMSRASPDYRPMPLAKASVGVPQSSGGC
jgi:hypothetical protein